jgi:hypothetical protein
MYGDTCSKNFFDFHKLGQKKTLLRELETKSGTIRGQSDLSHHITEFYSNFYSSEGSTSLGHSGSLGLVLGERPGEGHI